LSIPSHDYVCTDGSPAISHLCTAMLREHRSSALRMTQLLSPII
jgi:hypothetical protein